MQIDFKEKTAVVTGGAGGIGKEIVRAFARDGAKVALCDLKGAKECAAEFGSGVYGYDFDITDRESVAAAFAKISAELGEISVLVNNAGINVGPDERNTVDRFSDKWWDAIIRVDLDGTYNCTKAALKYMPDGSAIVNISSIVGMVALRNQCAFTAAKAGVINLTRAVAMELAPRNIRANAVCPGSIGIDITNELWQQNSAMQGLLSHIPLARQGKTGDVADAVEFLASDRAAYITGAVLPVDGGWTCGGFARDF